MSEYLTGETISALARRYDIDRKTVHRHLDVHHVEKRIIGRLDDHGRAEAIRRYRAGEAMRDIAEQLGVGYETIRAELCRAGVPIRTRGTWPRA